MGATGQSLIRDDQSTTVYVAAMIYHHVALTKVDEGAAE